MAIVKDDELKGFMERCLKTKEDKIGQIQGFIENNTAIRQKGGGLDANIKRYFW